MQAHKTVSREEWLEARRALLAKEKSVLKQQDALAADRRAMPWVKVEKSYMFDGPDGKETLADLFAAAKPGAILGVEQHRAASTGVQDPLAGDGYVQEAYVKLLAQEAGFTFVAATDINANPADTRQHPFGVWSLPPSLRSSPLGAPPDPNFDTAPFRAIGESDRMTLKFRRPAGPAAR